MPAPARRPRLRPAAATLSGTAATGAPVRNSAIELRCAAGTASTTSDANGAWSVSSAGLALPCVARVTGPAGLTPHSYIQGPGTTNITPITELVVAAAAQNPDTGTVFNAFNATLANVMQSNLASVLTIVRARLANLGVDTSGLNLLNQPFKPVFGDAYDDKLESSPCS